MSVVVDVSLILCRSIQKVCGDLKEKQATKREARKERVEQGAEQNTSNPKTRKRRHRTKHQFAVDQSSGEDALPLDRHLGISSEARATAEARVNREQQRILGQEAQSVMTFLSSHRVRRVHTIAAEDETADLPAYDHTASRLPSYEHAIASPTDRSAGAAWLTDANCDLDRGPERCYENCEARDRLSFPPAYT
ncbi:hypothetical protein CPB84DRAFT_1746686 [Gymnopilus junonius]|uniref:Uncharacterized protein n=1 Tax=Gymnopilus junonius TaxID=109634 RepID=A0A9P5NMN8_GYMJU|nr:hypothetical protein CPB84DRAFT_1746686 [Gymnopilus junonius]